MTGVGFPPPDPNDRQVWLEDRGRGEPVWYFRNPTTGEVGWRRSEEQALWQWVPSWPALIRPGELP